MKGFQLARDRGMRRLPQAVWDFYKDTQQSKDIQGTDSESKQPVLINRYAVIAIRM